MELQLSPRLETCKVPYIISSLRLVSISIMPLLSIYLSTGCGDCIVFFWFGLIMLSAFWIRLLDAVYGLPLLTLLVYLLSLMLFPPGTPSYPPPELLMLFSISLPIFLLFLYFIAASLYLTCIVCVISDKPASF